MAATRYFGTTSEHPTLNSDFVGAASGGTLSGAQVFQIVFDDTVFTSDEEGKQRFLAALEWMEQRLQTAHAWPIGTTS